MPEETQQPTLEPTQPQPSPEAPAGNAEPTPTPLPENQNSEPNPIPASPDEPMEQVPIPPSSSDSTEATPDEAEAPPSPESAVMDKDQNPANEPLGLSPILESVPIHENPNITVEKHGNDVTITEVMEPTAHSEPPTAQMAGNEPLAQKRKENLERANTKRQKKKREKIDAILNLFTEKQMVTNNGVEKLLHVSDATATRYLETLEKEGKIKQVGKTGKHTHYERI